MPFMWRQAERMDAVLHRFATTFDLELIVASMCGFLGGHRFVRVGDCIVTDWGIVVRVPHTSTESNHAVATNRIVGVVWPLLSGQVSSVPSTANQSTDDYDSSNEDDSEGGE